MTMPWDVRLAVIAAKEAAEKQRKAEYVARFQREQCAPVFQKMVQALDARTKPHAPLTIREENLLGACLRFAWGTSWGEDSHPVKVRTLLAEECKKLGVNATMLISKPRHINCANMAKLQWMIKEYSASRGCDLWERVRAITS